jgi:predicted RNase H-like nuclease (RuvC/YqgF family)
MTDEDRLLLKDLKANVQRLFQEYERLKTGNRLLEDKVTALNNEIVRLKNEKTDLSRENENIKLANHILSGKDGNGEAKKKINSLVREIDKCIALLNK